jgi:hypothetical protein
MTLTITADLIVSDITAHTTRAITPDSWELSWLPARRFTFNQAVSAMSAAEDLAQEPGPRDRIWSHIENWMAELDLDQAEWPWPDQTEHIGQAEARWS